MEFLQRLSTHTWGITWPESEYTKKTPERKSFLTKEQPTYAPDTDGALMAGDFRYTKSGGGDQGTGTETKIRLLLFKPSAATLAQFTPGKEYVLEMQPDFISNNGENT